ncbi:MAG: hypothetical protein KKB34_11565 [Bacteroidetes bacterium]|nr:hypothetical protein [Bacteroidota bacterium]
MNKKNAAAFATLREKKMSRNDATNAKKNIMNKKNVAAFATYREKKMSRHSANKNRINNIYIVDNIFLIR